MSCKLIIDGNSMINTVACAALYNAKETDFSRPFYKELDKYVIKGKAEEYYKEIIFKYLYGILHSLNYVDNIYFCFDKSSWRKYYYKKYNSQFSERPDFDKISEGYKSNRKIDNDKKEQIFELVKYISNTIIYNLSLCVKGIYFVSVDGLEGDDIIAHLTNKFKENNSVFIWSNDSDLHQLLDNNVCIIGPNEKKTLKKKMFTCETKKKTQENINPFDFISEQRDFSPSTFDNIVKMLTEKSYNNVIVNPVYELFTKILCGDKSSDNIFPCYSFRKDGKIVNVTKAKVSDIVYDFMRQTYSDKELLEAIDKKDDYILTNIAYKIFDIFNLTNHSSVVNEIKKGLLFNITMIRLSETIIPKELTIFIDRIVEQEKTKINLEEYKNYCRL